MHTAPDAYSGAIRLLRGAELFATLLDDDLAFVASRSETLMLTDGARLFDSGGPAERFYIVRSGEVAVSRPVDGRELELARFAPGDVVADFDFAAGSKHDANARAIGAVEVLAFPAEGITLETLALEKPDTSARILLRSLAMVAGRIRSSRKLIAENSPWVRELRRRVHVDAPTGLWNRTWFDEELATKLEGKAAFVLLKPDRFKALVDANGHGAGDLAMARIAARLQAAARGLASAWALRLRSNETAFIAPAADSSAAIELARRIAADLASIPLDDLNGGEAFPLSLSVAVALWPDDGRDARALLDRAREVLLMAWEDGGRRIYRVKPARSRGAAR